MSVRLNKRPILALEIFACTLLALVLVPVLSAQTGGSEQSAAPGALPSEGQQAAADAKEPVKQDGETAALIRLSGRARNMAGAPVAGAKIYIVSTNIIDRQLAETTTDPDGRYSFRDVKLPIHQPARVDAGGTLQVYGEAEGHGFAWHGMRHYWPRPRPADRPKDDSEFGFYQDEAIELDLTFRPAATLSGSVKDEKGRPVANARLSLSSLDYLETEEREFHHNYREFWAQYLAPPRFREVRTDDEGRFTFRGLPADTAGFAVVEHPDFASQSFFAAITDKPITEYRYISVSSVSIVAGKMVRMPIWETRTVRTSPLDMTVYSVRRVVVEVVMDDKGTPAKEVRIGASSGVDFATGTHAHGKTDDRGRVELKLPPGNYQLVADPPRGTSHIRTYSVLDVTSEPSEQTAKLQLEAGCILILEAVDADNGAPIADVSFWCDIESENGKRGRTGVQSSTTRVDHPVTNAKGELQAVVLPGERRYGVGWHPLPKGYRADRGSDSQLVKCEAGKTIRVQFKLTRE